MLYPGDLVDASGTLGLVIRAIRANEQSTVSKHMELIKRECLYYVLLRDGNMLGPLYDWELRKC